MALCSTCNRSFKSETSLNQHRKYSPVHAGMVPCDRCSIWLLNTHALEEHIRASPAHGAPNHSMSSMFKCDICNTSFVTQHFLNEHLQYSPLNATSLAHKFYSIVYLTRKALEENLQNLQSSTPIFEFKPCTTFFNDQSALDQHLESSSAHTSTFEFDPCDRSFASQDALDSHLQFASAHTRFECDPCNRSFINQTALEAHIQNSKAHAGERPQERRSEPTPLDIFFAEYPSFRYEPKLPPSVSYAKLVEFYDWDDNDPEARTTRREYQDALEDEVRLWFGSESDLASWNSLCRAVGIEQLPKSCDAAREAIRGVYVNIVDLIDWARKGRGDRPVHRFKNLEELREYTRLTGKTYPSRGHEQGEQNVVLRHLLRHIFH